MRPTEQQDEEKPFFRTLFQVHAAYSFVAEYSGSHNTHMKVLGVPHYSLSCFARLLFDSLEIRRKLTPSLVPFLPLLSPIRK